MSSVEFIQAKIISCDFEPEGLPDDAMTLTLSTSGNNQPICGKNVVVLSHTQFKKLIRRAKG